MRVLWLSPWLRTLARVHGEALRDAGDEVLLVTSDQHPEPVRPLDWELVLDPRPRTARTWAEFARALPEVRAFDADVVVTELVRDPRWMLFAGNRARVTLVHDDRSHDAGEDRPGWEVTLFDRWQRRGARTLCCSDHVAGAVAARGGPPVEVIGLTSDVADDAFGDPVPAAHRRDFVLVGRLNGYKNIPAILTAWQAHRESAAYRGDTLRLFGDAAEPPKLPADVWWNGGPYRHDDLIAALRRAKGSLAHYRVATQSGVQVLSMQAGVMPVVSTEGALPEFQPPGLGPVDKDDIVGLTAAFDLLADPDRAADLGAGAREWFRARHSAAAVATRLRRVFSELTDERSRTRGVATGR